MKTIIKKGLNLFSLSILAGSIASCFGGSNEYETFPLTDAELLDFRLYHNDSLPELEDVVFTIDQRGEGSFGLIYNYDSMAYMTELPEKVFVDYLSASGMDNVLNITDGDSIWLKSGDSIDISKPQTLKVFALDGVTTKLYIAQLNIHQVNPDSVQYNQIASDLSFLQTEDTKTVVFNERFLTYSRLNITPPPGYSSIQLHTMQDAALWIGEFSKLPENTVIRGIQSNGNRLFAYTEDGELYIRYDLNADQWVQANKPASIKIKSILGYLNAGHDQPEGLCMVVETDGINTFAFTEDFTHWEYDSISPTPIQDDFPLYDFSTHSYQVMLTERITIFGGTSINGVAQYSVWSTENGRYWAKLTGQIDIFPRLAGANIFYYNDEFWLINGILDDYYNENVYYSRDGGVTWQIKPEDYQLPEDYPERYNASLVADKDNKYFYIIGGKQTDVLPDIWRGHLNKLGFKH